MSDRPEKINLSDVHSRQVDTELLNELRDLVLLQSFPKNLF